MSQHCCGGNNSKEPLGVEGRLFVAGGIGWLLCNMITQETNWKTFGITGQVVCGVVVGLVFLKQIFWPRPKKKCDHHDHPD